MWIIVALCVIKAGCASRQSFVGVRKEMNREKTAKQKGSFLAGRPLAIEQERLRLGTDPVPAGMPHQTVGVCVNIRTIGNKKSANQLEKVPIFAHTLESNNVDFAFIAEHKAKSEVKSLEGKEGKYHYYFACQARRMGGTGIFIHEKHAVSIQKVVYVSSRLMWMAVTMNGENLILAPVYAPTLVRAYPLTRDLMYTLVYPLILTIRFAL